MSYFPYESKRLEATNSFAERTFDGNERGNAGKATHRNASKPNCTRQSFAMYASML